MNNTQLLDAVLEEIKQDIAIGDLTALAEMLSFVPITNLEAYLPDHPKGIISPMTLIDYLNIHGFDYKLFNNDYHVVVIGKDFQTYDIYPTSEKWKARSTNEWSKGLKNFYRELEGK